MASNVLANSGDLPFCDLYMQCKTSMVFGLIKGGKSELKRPGDNNGLFYIDLILYLLKKDGNFASRRLAKSPLYPSLLLKLRFSRQLRGGKMHIFHFHLCRICRHEDFLSN